MRKSEEETEEENQYDEEEELCILEKKRRFSHIMCNLLLWIEVTTPTTHKGKFVILLIYPSYNTIQ